VVRLSVRFRLRIEPAANACSACPNSSLRFATP
jgi:hypothetical protein